MFKQGELGMKLFTLKQIMTLSDDRGAMEGKPTWANLCPTKVPPESDEMANDLAGGGVYACFWKNELIYIGKFVHKEGNPLGGHVFERIGKHAAGFLQRDRRLFFRPSPFEAVLKMDNAIAADLRKADRSAMVKTEGKGQDKGKEVCSSKNKVKFAQSDWDFIKSASPAEIMENFSFAYQRIIPPNGLPIHSKAFINKWIINIEKILISDFYPPCNKEFNENRRKAPASPQEVGKIFDLRFNDAQFTPK